MILKKPYAFFIKYFRLINIILTLLTGIFIYKLSLISNVISQIYKGQISNYSSLSSMYIGYFMYLLIFVICLILLIIILLLKYKKKPFKDYLFLFLYNILIIVYLVNVNSMFNVLMNGVVEQSQLDLYSDISFIILIPLFYFLVKYFLISIGFNLKKFDFTKDVLEIKAEEKDNEEVELIFDKNTYKYKRSLRKKIREFKYYFLENKFFILIICAILFVILVGYLVSNDFFDNNQIKINENFVSNNISYRVTSVYETKYNLNNKIIKNGYKFVIANIIVRNISSEPISIDLKNIRISYGDEYSYATNYFNASFNDMGKPYNKELLNINDDFEYLFIFEVPANYNSNKYDIKFYSGVKYDDDQANAIYKVVKVKANDLDQSKNIKKFVLGDNTIINKSKYGDTNLTIRDYRIQNKFIESVNGYNNIIKPKDLNDCVLMINYELNIDNNSKFKELFTRDYDFFNKFLKIEYVYNGIEKKGNIMVINTNISNKIFVSVPIEISNSDEIRIILRFRDNEIVYKIK